MLYVNYAIVLEYILELYRCDFGNYTLKEMSRASVRKSDGGCEYAMYIDSVDTKINICPVIFYLRPLK